MTVTVDSNLPLSGKPKLSTRDGTDADRDRLALVLQQLGYKVMLHNNRSAADINQIIHEYADSHCRKEHDSFVCCILSHGTEGQVYGSDSQLVKIRDLSRKLAGCKSLTGKPKIFSIRPAKVMKSLNKYQSLIMTGMKILIKM